MYMYAQQRAKKVVSDSPGLVGFAIGLVNSVINLPDGQVKFFEESRLQRNCEINLLIKTFLGLVEMIFGLVNVSFSLPEWQAVKMTFIAPWHSLSKAFISQAYMGLMVVTCKLQLDVLMNGSFFFIYPAHNACLSIFFLGPERFQQNT